MNRSTPAPSGATVPVPGDQAPRPDAAALQLLPGTGPKQLDLPISFTATRGCDRIRARLWADHRLKGLVLDVCLALSEFADVRRKAWPKQTTLAKMVHASRQRVSMALSAAAKHAVLVKDRHRRGASCQYTFLESWIAWFRTPGEGSKELPQTPFRCHETRHLDVTKGDISGEPVQGNLISDRYAAAGTPRAREADRRRQQQQRQEDRIEGLFAAIAARAREAGRDYDEADERRRLAEGEIDVDRLQALADKLGDEIRERRLRRAHGPGYGRRQERAGEDSS
ncbi:MAG: hypothetical protein OXH50_17495 [Gemmatimonadetes bacterium]|nr:hypothetical protein [Gemmatimonadota bacterium]